MKRMHGPGRAGSAAGVMMETSMDLLQELLDSESGRVALLDVEGRVVARNRAWQTWCCCEAGDPDDLEALVLRLPEQADVAKNLAAVVAGTLAELRVDLGRLHGGDTTHELHAVHLASGGARVAIEDTTRRTLAEDELRLERRVAELMALSARLEDTSRALLHAIGSHVGADAGALWEPGADGQLRCTMRWVTPRLGLVDGERATPTEARRLVTRVFTSGLPALGSAVEGDVPEALFGVGLREVVAFPIVRGRRRFGVVELFAERIVGAHDRAIATLASLGQRIALFAERYRADKALRDIVEHAPDALFLVALDGRILMVSKLAEDLTQLPRDALVGLPIEDLIPPSQRKAHASLRQRFAHDGRARSMGAARDLLIVRADGREVPVDISLAPIETVEGRAVLAAVRDVSERRALEVEAGNQRRLEALAQMAAGIARDLDEPMEQVQSALELLAHELTPGAVIGLAGSPILAAVQRARDGMTAIAEVTTSLDQLVPTYHQARTLIDVNALVRTALAVSRNEWRPVAAVTTDLEVSLPRVEGHEADLTHALFELVLNAAHAVGARVDRAVPGAISIRTRLRDGWVEVEVEDNGIGMTREVRSHVFEPFFSTKPARRGRGQGLALVKAVVDSHGGKVVCDSREGHGTTFSLRFPIGLGPRQEMPRA